LILKAVPYRYEEAELIPGIISVILGYKAPSSASNLLLKMDMIIVMLKYRPRELSLWIIV
jgi:hypothetical protein